LEYSSQVYVPKELITVTAGGVLYREESAVLAFLFAYQAIYGHNQMQILKSDET